eukprot:2876868-Pyramimonas_sp.AAC.1
MTVCLEHVGVDCRCTRAVIVSSEHVRDNVAENSGTISHCPSINVVAWPDMDAAVQKLFQTGSSTIAMAEDRRNSLTEVPWCPHIMARATWTNEK